MAVISTVAGNAGTCGRIATPGRGDVLTLSAEERTFGTRPLTGEGRADREETDTHLFGPPGY